MAVSIGAQLAEAAEGPVAGGGNGGRHPCRPLSLSLFFFSFFFLSFFLFPGLFRCSVRAKDSVCTVVRGSSIEFAVMLMLS